MKRRLFALLFVMLLYLIFPHLPCDTKPGCGSHITGATLALTEIVLLSGYYLKGPDFQLVICVSKG